MCPALGLSGSSEEVRSGMSGENEEAALQQQEHCSPLGRAREAEHRPSNTASWVIFHTEYVPDAYSVSTGYVSGKYLVCTWYVSVTYLMYSKIPGTNQANTGIILVITKYLLSKYLISIRSVYSK